MKAAKVVQMVARMDLMSAERGLHVGCADGCMVGSEEGCQRVVVKAVKLVARWDYW